MPLRMTRLTVALVLFTLCLVAADASAAVMEEKDFKRMKIKELRNFLESRGLSCPGCQEKADFVRVAFQNREKKPLSEEGKREVPAVPFWDAWRDIARTVFEEAVVKRGFDAKSEDYKNLFDSVAFVTESFYMQHGRRTANKLRKKADALLKTSYNGVYYIAGKLLFERLANYCLASPANQKLCSSVGSLTDIFEGDKVAAFTKWITNVGIENTNPLYEMMEQREDL